MNKVPYEAAGSYYEAIQSMWFVHLILQIESNDTPYLMVEWTNTYIHTIRKI